MKTVIASGEAEECNPGSSARCSHPDKHPQTTLSQTYAMHINQNQYQVSHHIETPGVLEWRMVYKTQKANQLQHG